MIRRREDGRVAAEIQIEVDAAIFQIVFRETFVFPEENRGVGLAEAVDALLEIADEETIFAVGNEDGDELLDAVRVLVFVEHDFAVFRAEGERRLGRNGALGSRAVRQKELQGVVLHVVKFHEPVLLFARHVRVVKFEEKGGEHGNERTRGGHVAGPLRGRDGKIHLALFLHFLFHGRAERLDFVFCAEDIFIVLGADAGEALENVRANRAVPFVPRFGGRERIDGGVFFGNIFLVGGKRIAESGIIHEAQNAAVRIFPEKRVGVEVREQRAHPRNRVGKRVLGHVVGIGEMRDEIVRKRHRAGEAVNAQNFRAQIRIAIPGGVKVDEIGEIGIARLVVPQEDFGEHFVLEEENFIGLGENLEVGIDVEQVEIAAQNGLAEGINRGNIGPGKKRELAFQIADALGALRRGILAKPRALFFQIGGKRRRNPRPHFARCRPREGQNEEAVDGNGIVGVGDAPNDALDQNGGLPAAGRRRKQ